MGTATFDNLTPKQQRAIALLLAGHTPTVVVERLGIAERTLRRWRASDAFREALRAAQRSAFDEATAALQATAGEAVATLRTLLSDTATPAHVRCSAAVAVLKLGRDAVELDDLARRIAVLEQAVGRRGGL